MRRYNQKVERVCGRVFLVLFLLSLPVVWARLFVVGEKADPLDLEGRYANRMPELNAKEFWHGDFQNNLEKALADQMPASESIRTKYLDTKRVLFNGLNWISEKKDSNYRLIADGLYFYSGDDYLVRHYYDYVKANEAAIKESSNYYSNLPIENKYQYLVTLESTADFDHPEMEEEYVNRFASYYPAFKQSALKIGSYDNYKKLFTKTDHHWNYAGSYRGYQEIIRLILSDEEETIKPAEKVAFNYDFQGSKYRFAYPTLSHEKFTAYRFETKAHDTYVNGEKTIYGHQDEFFSDSAKRTEAGATSYGAFYGLDYATIKFDFHQPEKGNLLMIGYSDTNAIDELVASHFNQTFVIDPRLCTKTEFEKIITENDFEYFLLVPNSGAYIPALTDQLEGMS